jgi:predicted outer membrane repeat protein
MPLSRFQRQVVLGLGFTVILALLAVLILGLGPAEARRAVDVDVPCDTDALIAAIRTANGSSEANTLNLAAGCTYTLTAVDNDTDGPNGLPSIRGEMTINANGATIQRSDAPGTSPFRIFYVAWDSELTLYQLTLRNGDPGALNGGGIYNRGDVTLNGSTLSGNTGSAIQGLLGTLILTDTVISDNGAGIGSYGGTAILDGSTVSGNKGAGIHVVEGGVTLTGSTVSDNTGAGIHVTESELSIADSTIRDNRGSGIVGDSAAISLNHSTVTGNQVDGNGAGIASSSDTGSEVILTDSTVSGNVAGGDGAGIWVQGHVGLTLVRSTVRENVCAGSGGGIFSDESVVVLTDSRIQDNLGSGLYNAGRMTVTGSTISGNEAAQGMGGGIEHRGGTLSLTNSTVSGNTATMAGGGLYSESHGPISLSSSTVSNNQAADGGGIYSHGPVRLLSTIVAGQLAGGDCNGPGMFVSQGYNLDSDGSCTSARRSDDFTAADPLLGPLQDNGGPTETHALLPGSPAIDASGEIQCKDADADDDIPCSVPDQRGVSRPQDGDGNGRVGFDIGAYEKE